MTEGHNRSNFLTEILSNRPFIVGLFFLGTYFVPFLILLGVALAYVFKRDIEEDWEASHFEYLIRTFWIGLVGIVLAGLFSMLLALLVYATDLAEKGETIMLLAAGLGVTGGAITLVYCGIRIVISLMKSVAYKPMPNPKSWFI